jgi:hypothetical protein
MRRTIFLFILVLAAASCGGEPPAATYEQALDTYKNEQVGGCCDTTGGFRVGDPAPVLQFQAGAVLPPMPLGNQEHQFATFEIEAAISSQHADGGREKIQLDIYRSNSAHAYQLIVSTRDGDSFSTPVAKVVYPGDIVWVQWTFLSGCIEVNNNNGSGQGIAYDECTPFQFVNGQHYPDTVYPISANAAVVDCLTDMPYPSNGACNGSFQGWSLYGIGSNGPWHSTGIHVPANAGCGLALSDGTWQTTISWNRCGSI